MIGQRLYFLDAIEIGNRTIYPLAKLTVLSVKEIFISVNFTVVALKIKESDKIYYKNISLDENEFEKLGSE